MEDLLRQGIAAAKAGQREHARDLLMRVVEQDEGNALAWLWLSGVVDSLDDREVCLENVLSIEPDNQAARKGLDVLRRQRAEQLTREGVAAAKAGQRERARELLTRAVEYDENNVSAWLWLSGVVDSLDDRENCLKNALSLAPDNDAARRGLALLQKQKEEHRTSPAYIPESPLVARTRTAVSPAAAILHEDLARRRPPPEPELEQAPAPTQDEFDDPYLCPYCATPTEPEDLKCPACGNGLWIKFRRQEKRSTLLWVLIAFQTFSTGQLAAAPILLLLYIWASLAFQGLSTPDSADPLTLLNLYLGLRTNLSAETASAAFEMVPRAVFLLSFLPCLFSSGVLAGLYLRWKPVYYLLMVDAVIGVLTAFMAIFLSRGIVFGVIGLALALLRFLLVLQIEDDFRWDKSRLLLGIDRGLASGTDFVIRGDFYAKRKMWAMAVLHLRQAAGLSPNDAECHMALAVAYLRLKRYERAEQVLKRVQGIAPGDPQVEKLQALLEDMRAAASTASV
jgi:tetratricopeptide (TPR) repeat protein